MYPTLHETRGIVFRGIAYRVDDDVFDTFSSTPHQHGCFSIEMQQALSKICIISTACDVNEIPQFTIDCLWEYKIPCPHGPSPPRSRPTELFPSQNSTSPIKGEIVNVLYYLKFKEDTSNVPQLLLFKQIKQNQAIRLELRNSELNPDDSIVCAIKCKPLIVRTCTGRVVSWFELIHHDPMPEPNQSIPLNVHYLADFGPTIAVWNCCEVNPDDFYTAAHYLCLEYKPNMLLLTQARRLCLDDFNPNEALGYDSYMSLCHEGTAGGVIIMWDKDPIYSVRVDPFELGIRLVLSFSQ